MSRTFRVVISLAASFAITSCGGGGGNNSPTQAVPAQVPVQTISLGITPTTFNLTRDADPEGSLSITNLNIVNGYIYPFMWTMTGLPPGVSFDASTNGGIQAFFNGRPTSAGSFPVHVVIRDSSAGQPVKVDVTVTFVVDTAFKFANFYMPPAIQGLPYSYAHYVANGTLPLHFENTGEVLPLGLTLNPVTGEIAGTTNANPKHFVLGLKVTDSSNPPKTLFNNLGFDLNDPLAFPTQTITTYIDAVTLPHMGITGGAQFFKAKLIGGALPPGISFTDNYSYISFTGRPTQVGAWDAMFEVTDSYTPPEVVTGTVHFFVNAPPPAIQPWFPSAVVGVPYHYELSARDGTRPLTWVVGNLPPGLTANSSGVVSGTPTAAGRFQSITINVTDSSLPVHANAFIGGTILVKAALSGRNDSIATATTIVPNYGNGDYVFYSTLSPYAKATGVAQPDQDFYRVTVAPGATLKMVAEPHYTIGPTSVDPVIEFQDGTGLRMNNCRLPGTTTFSAACVNDDIDPGVNHAAQLEWQNTTASDQIFYVRVLDWSGSARPDFTYTMRVSGAK